MLSFLNFEFLLLLRITVIFQIQGFLFGSKYIRITFFAKIALSNNRKLQKMLINVSKLHVYVFLGVLVA